MESENKKMKKEKYEVEVVDAEIIDSNDSNFKIVKKKKEFVDKSKMKYLYESEFRRLKEVLDEENNENLKLIIMLQYLLALRVNEVLTLKVKDFEEKSESGKKYYIVKTKNSKQRREINKTKELRINAETSLLFLSVIIKNKLSKNDYICRTKYNKEMSARNYNKYLKKIFKKAEINEDKAHSHVFRHSRAIHLLDCGMNIAQVQRVLGHTSILNTMIYTKYSNYDINKMLEKIDEKIENNSRK